MLNIKVDDLPEGAYMAALKIVQNETDDKSKSMEMHTISSLPICFLAQNTTVDCSLPPSVAKDMKIGAPSTQAQTYYYCNSGGADSFIDLCKHAESLGLSCPSAEDYYSLIVVPRPIDDTSEYLFDKLEITSTGAKITENGRQLVTFVNNGFL